MSGTALEVGRKPLKERKRQGAAALTHSVNHWVRVEALAIFHEGEFTASEVAEMIGENVRYVQGHVKDLYDSGCIEFAGYKMVAGTLRPAYRAIVLPVVTDEAYRAMRIEDRRDANGALVQGLLAELVSSYRSEKMDTDENLRLIWQALNLDVQGNRELAELLAATWKGAKEINARAANRIAESGESGTSTVVGLLGFERGRAGRPVGGYRGRKK